MSQSVEVVNGQDTRKMLAIFIDECHKNDDWNSKYIHASMYLLGAGAYGSVFQVTSRVYAEGKQKIATVASNYHPEFLQTLASQRRMKQVVLDKLRDKYRHKNLLDLVAMKFEMLDQAHLESGDSKLNVLLRREFLILDLIWRKNGRDLIGFPTVFDFGYIGDQMYYGIIQKYRNIFTYLDMYGHEVPFFSDKCNKNLENVTKISYMTMELLGPSIDDIKNYFEPWFTPSGLRPFFKVTTVFKIADQFLCRLIVLHKLGFVHHDLKPDNIALGSGRSVNTLYLLDFGFTKHVSSDKTESWMGSRKFMSIDTYDFCAPNFAQDIESWFYIVLSLLYDYLPWCDDAIAEDLPPNANDQVKMPYVMNIKRKWWGDPKEATTLQDMITAIEQLHVKDEPDIKPILETLYKKVRDLRNVMRQIQDSKTLVYELNSRQSASFKGYMSLRRILLHIFNLPKLKKNQMLYDAELKTLWEQRTAKGLKQHAWDPNNFEWEWDMHHARIMENALGNSSDNGYDVDISHILRFNNNIERNIFNKRPSFDFNHSANSIKNKSNKGDVVSGKKSSASVKRLPVEVLQNNLKSDEVSYIYDRMRQRMFPKSRSKTMSHR